MYTSKSSMNADTNFYGGSNQHPYASVDPGNNGTPDGGATPTMDQIWEALMRINTSVNRF